MGDFCAIIDNSLGVGDTMYEIKDKFYELNEHWREYRNSSNYKGVDTCLDILDHLKKTTVLVNLDDLIEYIDLIIKKDYLKFLVKRFGKEREELLLERNSSIVSHPIFTSEEVKFLRCRQQDTIGSSGVNSPIPLYKSFTTEEFRELVIKGKQGDIIASI
jgi:hypothetical protein